MVAHGKQDLVHLEHRRQGLDQHRALDGAVDHAKALFGEAEHTVPPGRLGAVFQLGDVVIDAALARHPHPVVVKEIEAEIHQAAGDRLAIHQQMFFRQMEAARPGDQHRRVGSQLIALAVIRVGVTDGAQIGIAQINLPLHHVLPGGRGGVLKAAHVDLHRRVEGIDDHLALHRPGDLHPAVEQIMGDASNAPLRLADIGGLRIKIRQFARIKARLPRQPLGQQRLERATELTHQRHQILTGRLGQNAVISRVKRRGDGQAATLGVGGGCRQAFSGGRHRALLGLGRDAQRQPRNRVSFSLGAG